MQERQLPNLSQFTTQTPQHIAQHIQALRQLALPLDSNWWTGLAFVAADNVHRLLKQGQTAESLQWARIAIDIYEFLDREQQAGCDSCLRSAMALRVALINQLGPLPGDALRDLAQLSAWVLRSTPFSYADVADKLALSVPELAQHHVGLLLALRKLKARLNIVQNLQPHYVVQLDARVQHWLTQHAALP